MNDTLQDLPMREWKPMRAALLAPTAMPAPPPDVFVLPPMVHGSKEWLDARRGGVTGTDAGPIAGCSDFTTPFEVYLDKLDQLPPLTQTGPLEWGHILEPVVRDHFVRKTGLNVFVPQSMFRSVRHEFMLANVDGLINAERALYEGKTARTAEGWGEPGTDEVPLHILLQTQHYMVVTGFRLTYVAVLIGGSDFRIYEVHADPEMQGMLVEVEGEFWQRVIERRPPPVESIADVRRRWGSLGSKGIIVATHRVMDACETLRAATEQRKALEAVEAEQQAIVMSYLADCDTLADPENGRALATWKLAKAADHFDLDTFRAEHAALARQYTQPGTASRRFLLKKPTTSNEIRRIE